MSDRQAIEDAMNQFARSQVALNAKVLAVEHHAESNIWTGVAVSSAGNRKLVARKQPDGTWQVSKYLGSISSQHRT
jgi:hypothetical protein